MSAPSLHSHHFPPPVIKLGALPRTHHPPVAAQKHSPSTLPPLGNACSGAPGLENPQNVTHSKGNQATIILLFYPEWVLHADFDKGTERLRRSQGGAWLAGPRKPLTLVTGICCGACAGLFCPRVLSLPCMSTDPPRTLEGMGGPQTAVPCRPALEVWRLEAGGASVCRESPAAGMSPVCPRSSSSARREARRPAACGRGCQCGQTTQPEDAEGSAQLPPGLRRH